MQKEPCYSERLDDALVLVADAFRHTTRKGTGQPYLSHLLQVAVWVMENGGDEEQIVAALLHDYLEDIEGTSVAELAERFGPRVARLVEALSDTTVWPKPPWKARKTAYITKLRTQPTELKLICVCDKLHNATSILRDLDVTGETLWDRFRASKEETLWYYREVVAALAHDWDHPLVDRLRDTVTRMG